MHKNNIDIAESYYLAMGQKNPSEAVKYLHPNVEFIGPLAEIRGKEAVAEAVKRFTSIYNSLNIRAKFGSGDQAVIVYDLDCPAPTGRVRATTLMNIRGGLIEKMELFYDARPFEKKKEQIFENKSNALSSSK